MRKLALTAIAVIATLVLVLTVAIEASRAEDAGYASTNERWRRRQADGVFHEGGWLPGTKGYRFAGRRHHHHPKPEPRPEPEPERASPIYGYLAPPPAPQVVCKTHREPWRRGQPYIVEGRSTEHHSEEGEGHRVLKAMAANDTGKERWRNAMPLAKAKATRADVAAFWASQFFDLQLRSYEGNCDLCMLKARAKLGAIIRENPGIADWWIEQEKATGGRFVTEYSYADLQREQREQGHLFDGFMDEHDAECGLLCSEAA